MAGLLKSKQRFPNEEEQEEAVDAEVEDTDEVEAEADGDDAEAPESDERTEGGGQLKTFVENGMRLIFDKKGLPQLLQSMEGGGNPVEGLANTLAAVVTRLTDSAEKKGVQLSADVVLRGTREMIQQLADFSKESDGHEYTDKELKSVWMAVLESTTGYNPEKPAQPEGMPMGDEGAPVDAQPMQGPPMRRGMMS